MLDPPGLHAAGDGVHMVHAEAAAAGGAVGAAGGAVVEGYWALICCVPVVNAAAKS